MFIAWNPLGGIVEGIQSFVFGILLFLDALIYSLVNWVYQIILVLSNNNILENNFEINNLIQRIYIIIGVVVLFIVAYSLLKTMINPDEALKGKKSPVNIIKDVIISVALIALLPTIFEFAFNFQEAILNNNTLGNLILGTNNKVGDNVVDSKDIISQGGMTISSGVLNAFLHPNYTSDACEKVADTSTYQNGYDCSKVIVETNALNLNGDNSFDNFWQTMISEGTVLPITDLNNNIVEKGDVTYYFIISTIAGVVVLFVLISYCFDIAIRSVKLAVFELIAPLPILSRIIPNEQGGKVFSNWLKATIATYIEVFIRLAILFFSVLIIKIVIQNFPNIFILFEGSSGFTVALFAQMFLILGIILFVKQAPGIVKDITGLDGGKYGKSFMKGIGMMAATLGGGATATIRSVANDKDKPIPQRIGRGLLSGANAARRGLLHGYKTEKFGDIPKAAGKSASNALGKRAKVEAAGGNAKYLKQWMADKKKDTKGWITGGFEAQQKILEQINSVTQAADEIKNKTEGFVRDKKYIFSMKKNGERENISYSKGNFTIDDTTSLSEIETIIKTLNGTGDVNDSKIADRLNNDMQIRIKDIGKELSKAAVNKDYNNFKKDNVVKRVSGDESTTKFVIENEAKVELSQAESKYSELKQRIAANPSLADLKNVKTDFASGIKDIKIEKASDLSKALKVDAADIQQQITLEQERRKAKEKK